MGLSAQAQRLAVELRWGGGMGVVSSCLFPA